VIGVSPDEVAAIEKFAGKYDLGFTLLADADHAVAEKYGTWVEKSMYGKRYMGVARATFIIDPDRKIAKVFPKVSPKKHDDLVLKALGELAAA
jgi:thioredoxin-dependent peroxiredoxin